MVSRRGRKIGRITPSLRRSIRGYYCVNQSTCFSEAALDVREDKVHRIKISARSFFYSISMLSREREETSPRYVRPI